MNPIIKLRLHVTLLFSLLTILAIGARPALSNECFIESSVDCSTGWINVVPAVAAYNHVFESACVKHDFCYRYGSKTYGHTRGHCDKRFLQDMRKKCGDPTFWDFLTLGLTAAGCYGAAEAYSAAVRNLGSSAFKSNDSRFCEYEGPASFCEDASANDGACWTRDFSEEGSGEMRCPVGKAAAGLWCKGSYCDNKSLFCKPLAVGSERPQNAEGTKWISEEQPNASFRVDKRETLQFVTGLKCKGGYCDKLSAYVTTAPNNTRTGHWEWMPFFSEEQGGMTCADDQYLTGLGCKGSNCDKLSLHCTSVSRTKSKFIPGIPLKEGLGTKN